ncbi:MAG: hypothetical protein ACOH1J_05320 [Microbacteriaceae bacterium]
MNNEFSFGPIPNRCGLQVAVAGAGEKFRNVPGNVAIVCQPSFHIANHAINNPEFPAVTADPEPPHKSAQSGTKRHKRNSNQHEHRSWCQR